METATAPARYMATDLVRVFREKGRRSDWVAAQVGMHPTALSHIARGRRSIDAGRAEAIANVLDVELASIFTEAASDVEV